MIKSDHFLLFTIAEYNSKSMAASTFSLPLPQSSILNVGFASIVHCWAFLHLLASPWFHCRCPQYLFSYNLDLPLALPCVPAPHHWAFFFCQFLKWSVMDIYLSWFCYYIPSTIFLKWLQASGKGRQLLDLRRRWGEYPCKALPLLLWIVVVV